MRAVTMMLALAPLALFLALPREAAAESGYAAWLRYAYIDNQTVRAQYDSLPACTLRTGDSDVLESAERELIRGVSGMLGRSLRSEPPLSGRRDVASQIAAEGAIILGSFKSIESMPAMPEGIKQAALAIARDGGLAQDGYALKAVDLDGRSYIIIAGPGDVGALYGVFGLLRKINLGQPVSHLDERQSPRVPVRMLNHWDNLDGTIERGYAGLSIFFDRGHVVQDLTRVGDYARLMASIGVNSCSINNVNADPEAITSGFLPELGRVAAAFRPWGVKLFVSVDLGSPQKIGGLDTFDPLDPRVSAWWKHKEDEIYALIPDFGGFVLKADSEGRVGPSAYKRTHADAANAIARGLKPHGGLLFYRGFVYDNHADWRNLKNDRAAAAYNNFKPLDGDFEDNVVIQIKYGPIDFQVREPVSPLFGALERTNEALELQVTQEYTGQQRHLCFLLPMWKEVLDFDTHAKAGESDVKDVVAGKTFNRTLGAMVAVTNVGRDINWLGHPLAMANLYAFGRIAWNPNLSSRDIIDEWTQMTFGPDPQVIKTIGGLQLDSWPAYEKYTGPLGVGTLTDIIHVHYGPAPMSSEHNGWGQWHRADENGIGMDRTVATGTGFIGQYRPPVAAMYESLSACPDDLLLFMHHVPYTHVLHSGKTVIQYMYDSHYEGAQDAAGFVDRWKTLKGKIDDERYVRVLDKLEYQAGHAIVWRDSICNWLLKLSGIPDANGRAGRFPERIEAESMKLQGYQVIDVTPWEAASGSKAIAAGAGSATCAASFVYHGKPGWHAIAVQYFDQNNGAAGYRLLVGGQVIDEWKADDDLPTDGINSHSSTRRTVHGVALRDGDQVMIEGTPDGGERAAIDYVEISPESGEAPPVSRAAATAPAATD